MRRNEKVCYGNKERDVNHIEIEVLKDYYGNISYLVKGANIFDANSIFDFTNILKTDDFNEAFDLRLKLEVLFGKDLYNNKETRAHVIGSLQADPNRWHAEEERTPFNQLLIQSTQSKTKNHTKHSEPER